MFLNTIILAGAVQGFLISILLLIKKNKNPAEKVLLFWMGAVVFHLFVTFLLHSQIINNRFLIIINSGIPFIQAPMIYLYFTVLFLGRIKRGLILIHFIPALLGIIYPFIGIPVNWFAKLLSWYIILSVPVYSLWILYSWIGLNTSKDSDYKKKSLWLIYPLIGLLVIWISFIVLRSIPNLKLLNLHTYFFIAVTLFVYLISIHLFRIRQDVAFTSIEGDGIAVDSLETALKYKKSGLSEAAKKEIEESLKKIMVEEKPFLDPEITLVDLAAKLKIKKNHLSQVINERIGYSFNEYLNKHRLDEFLLVVQDPAKKIKTILGLALDCGFNSKSSFNRIFKKEIGKSPSEYLIKDNKN